MKAWKMKKFWILIFLVLFALFGFLCETVQADTMTIRPDADQGINNWTPINCTDHYDCVNEETTDDTDYLSEDTQYDHDRWTMQDVSGTIPGGSTIDSVLMVLRLGSTAGQARSQKGRVWIGTDNTNGTVRTVLEFTTYSEEMAAPGGRTWLRENLDSLVVSVERSSSSSGFLVTCSQAYVTVHYTTGAPAAGQVIIIH